MVVFLIIGTSAISNNDDQLTRQLLNRSSLVEKTTWRPRVIQREGGDREREEECSREGMRESEEEETLQVHIGRTTIF